MNRILLFCFISFFAFSCAKKTVASFAPSPSTLDVTKKVLEEEKQMVVTELMPTRQANQTSPIQGEQKSVEEVFTIKKVLASSKKPKESTQEHVDRIMDSTPKIQKSIKASFNKKNAQVHGPQNWAPQLKIGLSLLAIGVVLAVFGLGFVGGLAAFIGLLFTIVGLLVTY
jgi:hypothetical protein